jgi:hypothetical protein
MMPARHPKASGTNDDYTLSADRQACDFKKQIINI